MIQSHLLRFYLYRVQVQSAVITAVAAAAAMFAADVAAEYDFSTAVVAVAVFCCGCAAEG